MSQEDIPVTWDSEPAYDGGTEGSYRFTADVSGHVLSKGAKPPQIMVTVTLSTDTVEHPVEGQPEAPILCTKTQGCTLKDGHEGQCVTEQLPANDALVKDITGWKFVATDYSDYIGNELAIPNVSMEHQADFAVVVSMLPTQISAVIDGEEDPETLDITRWDCPEYAKTEEGNWPVSGEYTFTAAIQPGYSCDPLPAVRVLIGGADLLSDATWDGQSPQKASELTPKVNPGDTITITGSSTSGATLTVDVNNITVTSDGNSVNGVSILVDSSVDSLTIKELNLIPKDGKKHGIEFKSASTLIAEGSCTIYGPFFDNFSLAAIYSNASLNLKVADNAELKLIGDQNPTERGNYGIRTLGSLIVDVGSGGSLTVENTQGRQKNGSAIYSGKSLTINNNGTVLATVIDQSGASPGAMYGIDALGNTILSGSGTTTARGEIGLSVTGDLTVDGHVLAEGTSVGVALEKTRGQFCKLTGSGELTAKSIGGGNDWEMGYGIWVIYAGLDMAFEGKLTAHGGIGGLGCGIYVSGPVVIRKTPKELEVQKGTGTIAFASADGSLTNHTDMNILLNIDIPIAWPDIVLPSVLIVAPDGPYADINGRVDIIFSETIKDGPGTVTLTGGGDSITLTGGYWDVPYWEYTGKSWFIIDYAGLKNSTTYTVNISGFQDKAGNVMAADSSHTFTTIQGGGNTYIPSSGGGGGGGGGGSSIVSQPKNNYTVAGDRIHLSLTRSDIQQLSDSGNSLIIQSNTVKMTFNSNALRAILDASSGLGDSITFTAEPADLSALPAAAGSIGARPAYDFAVSCKDAGGSEVKIKVDFPQGSASVAMNYIPEAGETTGSLFMVYADESGSVTWLPKSCFNSGKILADIPHFSVYGVGYDTQVPAFSDTQGHWAKEDIEFASARKLLTGTEHGLFSPDSAVTRGTLAAALGRLAGVNPESYQTRSFRDVRPDAFYAPYIEWAAQNNLVNSTEDNLFNPDAPVTREHLAVIISNYAGLTGYSIPSPLHETPFADSDAISQWAADQVKSMQMAGIMKGKEGNRFEPQANATRAESSALLHRFVELAMDPSTAQGWKRNDSGYWLFYRDGKALTGWQSVDDKEYYFEPDGTWVPEAKKET